MSGLITPTYFGGKTSGRAGLGVWIQSHLPHDYEGLYVEVFGGLFGVGLNRPMSKCEIYNDRDECLVVWFRALRDHPDEFAYRVSHTPRSRSEFNRALSRIRDTSLPDLDRGVDVHTVIQQSLGRTVGDDGRWSRYLMGAEMHRRPGLSLHWYRSESSRTSEEMILRIYDRIKYLQLENKDAIELLNDISDRPWATIYVDPPYAGAKELYQLNDSEMDRDALTKSLLSQSGNVAVSGYPGEWDHLGWRSVSKSAKAGDLNKAWTSENTTARTEVLWMNYEPEQKRLI